MHKLTNFRVSTGQGNLGFFSSSGKSRSSVKCLEKSENLQKGGGDMRYAHTLQKLNKQMMTVTYIRVTENSIFQLDMYVGACVT